MPGWAGSPPDRQRPPAANVTAGRLSGGLPYLRLGRGPPLVMALGSSAEHARPDL
jgi:hypothetical protein